MIGAMIGVQAGARGGVHGRAWCSRLQINYPDLANAGERIDAHARAALMMAGVLFAAGAFTGIMRESGMLTAMAKAAVAFVPPGAGAHLPVVAGTGLDAAQPAVRSRIRSISACFRCWRRPAKTRGRAGADGAGGGAWPDDYRISGKPPHSGDVLDCWFDRGGVGGAPEVRDPVPVWGVHTDDGRLA